MTNRDMLNAVKKFFASWRSILGRIGFEDADDPDLSNVSIPVAILISAAVGGLCAWAAGIFLPSKVWIIVFIVFFVLAYMASRYTHTILIGILSVIGATCLFLVIMFLVSPSDFKEKEPPVAITKIIAGTAIADTNLRAKPSAQGALIKTIAQGEVVSVTGDASGGWLPVTHDGDEGWVSAEHFTIEALTIENAKEPLTKEQVKAQKELGRRYVKALNLYTRKNYDEAFPLFQVLADEGHAPAQNMLGQCFSLGYGTEKDDAQAVEWFRKAADQGLPVAQNNLGNYYYAGREVEQDYAWAVELYTKAAAAGNAWGQYSLGVCLENGRGVAQDYAKAAEWYRKASKQGNYKAQEALKKLKAEGKI